MMEPEGGFLKNKGKSNENVFKVLISAYYKVKKKSSWTGERISRGNL
jgi:hypothetical protein